jgi:hypothetical protein
MAASPWPPQGSWSKPPPVRRAAAVALRSQSFEHAAIFRVELVFHMDFARRHIDEKIIRMRIDVGDVGDAQLPPALNLALGVG